MASSAILVALSALLSALCFPSLNLFWLWPMCLVPLFISIYQAESKRHILFSFWGYGLLYMAFSHLWFFSLTPFAEVWQLAALWVLASFVFGSYYLITGALFLATRKQWFLLPFCWMLGEWLRGLGPFGNTNGSLGYMWAHMDTFVQWASLWGVFGLSAMIVLVNVIVLHLIVSHQQERYAGALLALLAVYFSVGTLLERPLPVQDTQQVYIVQGNHAQLDKLNRKKWPSIRADFIRLSQSIPQLNQAVVFFPETITPGLNFKMPEFITPMKTLSTETDSTFIVGTPLKENGLYYNGASSLSPSTIRQEMTYKKIRLMPFGEYFPFKPLFHFLKLDSILPKSEYSAGEHMEIIPAQKSEVGIGICLESIFPSFYRHSVKEGADVLAVLVNNAWFGESAAAEQHLLMSRLRAVEQHRTVIQAANTGISAIISPQGELLSTSRLNEQTILSRKISLFQHKTIFYYIEPFYMWVILALLILLSFPTWFFYHYLRKNLD